MRKAITVLVLLALLVGGDLAAQGRKKQRLKVNVGDTVADFTLPDLDAKKTSLKSLATDKTLLVIDFWSITCPYCTGSEKSFVALNKKFEAQKVQFVHINSNRTENRSEDTLAKVKAAVKEHGITFPVLIDRDNKIADVFGAPVTPTVFILDAKTLEVVYTGAPNDNPARAERVTEDYIDTVLTARLAGKEPKVTATSPKG